MSVSFNQLTELLEGTAQEREIMLKRMSVCALKELYFFLVLPTLSAEKSNQKRYIEPLLTALKVSSGCEPYFAGRVRFLELSFTDLQLQNVEECLKLLSPHELEVLEDRNLKLRIPPKAFPILNALRQLPEPRTKRLRVQEVTLFIDLNLEESCSSKESSCSEESSYSEDSFCSDIICISSFQPTKKRKIEESTQDSSVISLPPPPCPPPLNLCLPSYANYPCSPPLNFCLPACPCSPPQAYLGKALQLHELVGEAPLYYYTNDLEVTLDDYLQLEYMVLYFFLTYTFPPPFYFFALTHID